MLAHDSKKVHNQEELLQLTIMKLELNEGEFTLKYGRDNLICLECNTLDTKLKAMARKKEFRGSNIWVDDDKTKREIEVQKWIRYTAKRMGKRKPSKGRIL